MTLDLVVCTISDEGTTRKKELVGETMERLIGMRNENRKRMSIVGAHLEGYDSPNTIMMRTLLPDIGLIKAPEGNFVQRAREGMRRLFLEAKKKVREATEQYPRVILYMEGDKPEFVEEIPRVIDPILMGRADVTIAERSEDGFEEFPFVQRVFEGRANREIASLTGRGMDLMYGPRAWSAEAAGHFVYSGRDDFGALTYSVVRAMAEGDGVVVVKVPGHPQRDYMNKYHGQ